MVTAAILGFALFLAVFIDAIYFYRKHYFQLPKEIDDSELQGEFLFAASRFIIWGRYCLSPKRAERDGVSSDFESLPSTARRQLILHWAGVLTICLLFVISSLFTQ